MNRKIIAQANLVTFINEIVEATKLGWEVDEKFEPALYGFYYEAQLVRDESIVDEPKLTPAESLAKARAAKAAKAKADAEAAATE